MKKNLIWTYVVLSCVAFVATTIVAAYAMSDVSNLIEAYRTYTAVSGTMGMDVNYDWTRPLMSVAAVKLFVGAGTFCAGLHFLRKSVRFANAIEVEAIS